MYNNDLYAVKSVRIALFIMSMATAIIATLTHEVLFQYIHWSKWLSTILVFSVFILIMLVLFKPIVSFLYNKTQEHNQRNWICDIVRMIHPILLARQLSPIYLWFSY